MNSTTYPAIDAIQAALDGAALVPWPDPEALPDALPPVDPFDADLLPEALSAWVMDIAHRMQCPADFPAVAAIVAISSLIGARAVIKPKEFDDWQVVPNQWGLIVGRPGAMKSPALSAALGPLDRLQAAAFEQSKAEHDEWLIDCQVADMAAADRATKAKKLADKDPAEARRLLTPDAALIEPTARRFIVNDATVEKLGELMMADSWGTLSYRDELHGLLTGMDKQGQEGARSFYLQSYDGNQGYTFDRIARGTVRVQRVCLSMLGGTQPGRLQGYVRGAVSGGSADDGLLQRFGMAVWPDSTGDYVHVDQWPDTQAKQIAYAVFERLAQLQPASETEPTVWSFDKEAQELFNEWRTPFEQELRSGELHPAMESHLAKYRKLVPTLALVFAQIDTPDAGTVGVKELVRALAWSEYLRSHAKRVYSAAVMPETFGAHALLAKLKAKKLTDADGVLLEVFTARLVAQKHWAGLEEPEAVRKAAAVLVDHGWLRVEVSRQGSTMGRTSESYSMHPTLTGGATS